MTGKNVNFEISDDSSIRSLSKMTDLGGVRITVDLVPAARRHIAFLRSISDSSWPHHTPTLLRAIQRYEELWMPLISTLSEGLSKPPMLLPPIDIQWVWHCHCLNPASYRQYCKSRFSKVIEKAAIFDDENEEYAMNRCREIWTVKYPFEPFDLEEPFSDTSDTKPTNADIFEAVTKYPSLYSKFSEPFMSEMVYLIAAKQRYKGFLHLLERCREEYNRLVPTCDIQLMLLTHMGFPSRYEEDLMDLEGDLKRVVGVLDGKKEEEVEETKKLWERMFDQPYEKAGASFDGNFTKKWPICREVLDADVDGKYKALERRFLLETYDCQSKPVDWIEFLSGNVHYDSHAMNGLDMLEEAQIREIQCPRHACEYTCDKPQFRSLTGMSQVHMPMCKTYPSYLGGPHRS